MSNERFDTDLNDHFEQDFKFSCDDTSLSSFKDQKCYAASDFIDFIGRLYRQLFTIYGTIKLSSLHDNEKEMLYPYEDDVNPKVLSTEYENTPQFFKWLDHSYYALKVARGEGDGRTSQWSGIGNLRDLLHTPSLTILSVRWKPDPSKDEDKYGGIISCVSPLSTAYSEIFPSAKWYEWYKNTWNLLYDFYARAHVQCDDWKVYPAITNLDSSLFEELIDECTSWKEISSEQLTSLMYKEYTSNMGYPTTRWHTYGKPLLYRDLLGRGTPNNSSYLSANSVYGDFWRKIYDFLGVKPDELPEWGQISSSFVKDDDVSEIIGGLNSLCVGFDLSGWNIREEDMRFDRLSTWSSFSMPMRYDEPIQNGCTYYSTIDCKLNLLHDTYGYPDMTPPLRFCYPNLYVLSYYWWKYLTGDGNMRNEFNTHATSKYRMPFWLTDRTEEVRVDWYAQTAISGQPVLTGSTEHYCGKIVLSLTCVKSDSEWLDEKEGYESQGYTYDQLKYYRYHNTLSTIGEPASPLYALYKFGDLGRHLIEYRNGYITMLSGTDYPEARALLLKCFPLTELQQKADDIEEAEEEYQEKYDDLTSQIEDKQEELSVAYDNLSAISSDCILRCWDSSLTTVYDAVAYNTLSDYMTEGIVRPSNGKYLSGDWSDMWNYPFQDKLLSSLNEYLSANEDLSVFCPLTSDWDLLAIDLVCRSEEMSACGYTYEVEIGERITDVVADGISQTHNFYSSYFANGEELISTVKNKLDRYQPIALIWLEYLAQWYYTYLAEVDTQLEYIALILEEIDELYEDLNEAYQEYLDKLKEIEEKEYESKAPDISELDELLDRTELRWSGDNTTAHDTSWVYRSVQYPMDAKALDRFPYLLSCYNNECEGLKSIWPLALSSLSNEMIDGISYMKFLKSTGYVVSNDISATTLISNYTPIFATGCDNFSAARCKMAENIHLSANLHPYIECEDKADFFGGDLESIDKYNISTVSVDLYVKEPSIDLSEAFSPVHMTYTVMRLKMHEDDPDDKAKSVYCCIFGDAGMYWASPATLERKGWGQLVYQKPPFYQECPKNPLNGKYDMDVVMDVCPLVLGQTKFNSNEQ